jgi:cystathionine beta-lyase
MSDFSNDNIDLALLKKKAFNYRWAEVEEGCIPLTAADPDFKVAKPISKAIMDYAQEGYFSYTPKRGLPEFKEAMSAYLKQTKGEIIDPDHILPVDSAARGMYIIAEAILAPGDEAIVFDPVDYLFRESVLHAGGKLVLYPAKIKDGKVDLSDLESYITPKCKMIGLCNPHNPLGKLYDASALKHILDLAKKYDLYIMNDEIWSDITYSEKPFTSILNVDPDKNNHVLSVFGFSKSFGIAGLRIGAIYTHNDALFEKCIEASCVDSTAGGVSSLSQIAAIACMNECRSWLADFKVHLEKMRNLLTKRINAMPGLSCQAPEGTYLAYVDVSSYGMTSKDFCDFVQKKGRVALIPGGEKFFGAGSEGFIRICFATSEEILNEGLSRLEAALAMLKEEQKNQTI